MAASVILPAVLRQVIFPGEPFLTHVARKGNAPMLVHVSVVIRSSTKSFTTIFTPEAEGTGVVLVMPTKGGFRAEGPLAAGALVPSRQLVKHAKDV